MKDLLRVTYHSSNYARIQIQYVQWNCLGVLGVMQV